MEFSSIDELLNWTGGRGINYEGSKVQEIIFPSMYRHEWGNFILRFDEENPDPAAFKEIMTSTWPKRCNLTICGVRKPSGNWFVEGELLEAYKGLVEEINQIRTELGMKPINH